ncbi:MAG: NYN domain-containing protein [bacterium]
MFTSKARVILFIDYQNTYKCARKTFFPCPDNFTQGQYDPLAMGKLICSKAPPEYPRILKEVRVYSGQPDGHKEPKGYGATQKQFSVWRKKGIVVITRPLRYPPDWPDSKAEEKGIDVQIAIDFIAAAIDKKFDIGIIASTDTDLIPAIEFVCDRYKNKPRAEACAWRGPGQNRQLYSKKYKLWCHYLKKTDYDSIIDSIDYTK